MSANQSSTPNAAKRIQLHDGRTIGYAEYGDPYGRPVFFFHGWPGSRLFIRSRQAQTAALGVRLIACERPGFGVSDFQAGRQLLDWPDDVAEVANQLGIKRFAVAGHSGGGPYALACAYKIPARITMAALISSFAPLDLPCATKGMMRANKLMFSLAKHSSWLHKLLLLFMIRGGATRFMEGMVSSLPQVDKDILSGMEKGEENIAESFRCGIKGPAWDQYILARPWGFCLEGINVAVRLWQGDQDVMVPPSMGQYLAKRLTQCQAAFCAGEGHMLIFPRWDEILTALAG